MVSYPPDETLHLIRMSMMVMQEARGLFGLSEYSFINARHYAEIDCDGITWYQCAKMLKRSERFIRMVRALAYAPSQKPARIIYIPERVLLLFASQAKNPRWCIETFETMGMGAKLCVQLFQWLGSIVDISLKQQKFLTFLTSKFPDWLPQMVEIQREIRGIEFANAIDLKTMEVLSAQTEIFSDDAQVVRLIKREIHILRVEVAKRNKLMEECSAKERLLIDNQFKREEHALISMEIKVHF